MQQEKGNCESRNAGTWNGTRNGDKTPEIRRKVMNAHAHIVKAHMVVGATIDNIYGATAKSTR